MRELDIPTPDVDRGHRRAEAHVDGVILIELRGPQEIRRLRCSTRKVALRQVRPVAGQRVIGAEHRDAAAVALATQCFRSRIAGRTAADDHGGCGRAGPGRLYMRRGALELLADVERADRLPRRCAPGASGIGHRAPRTANARRRPAQHGHSRSRLPGRPSCGRAGVGCRLMKSRAPSGRCCRPCGRDRLRRFALPSLLITVLWKRSGPGNSHASEDRSRRSRRGARRTPDRLSALRAVSPRPSARSECRRPARRGADS